MPADAARALRDTLGHWATGVAVVTTRDPAGRAVGMTVNSFSSLSLDPPLVLWSACRGVDPWQAFEDSGHFAVNILRSGQEALSNRFADPASPRFEGLEHEVGLDGLPLLRDTLACLQCAVVARHDGGDHRLHIGRVIAARHQPGPPLLYFAGGYRGLAPA